MLTSKNQTSGNKLDLLNSRRLPARLTADQVAAVVGCSIEDVPVLVSAKLLSPLGKPRPSAVKRFAACTIEQMCADPKWLDNVTKVISHYWMNKNARRRTRPLRPGQNETPEAPPITS